MADATAEAAVHETAVEVRYAETDQMGIVHHSNYLVWFELARTGLCATSGFPYHQIEAMGYQLVVTHTETRHLQPARYGDTVLVRCRGEQLWSRGLRFAYDVQRGDTLLATGATEHVWLNAATGRPCRTPEPLRAPFRRLAGLPVD